MVVVQTADVPGEVAPGRSAGTVGREKYRQVGVVGQVALSGSDDGRPGLGNGQDDGSDRHGRNELRKGTHPLVGAVIVGHVATGPKKPHGAGDVVRGGQELDDSIRESRTSHRVHRGLGLEEVGDVEIDIAHPAAVFVDRCDRVVVPGVGGDAFVSGHSGQTEAWRPADQPCQLSCVLGIADPCPPARRSDVEKNLGRARAR